MPFQSNEADQDVEGKSADTGRNTKLFSEVAEAIYSKGYCIVDDALPVELQKSLSLHAQELSESQFKPAGVGRGVEHGKHNDIRQDSIFWINGDTKIESQWLAWAEGLQDSLNQRLFLGLFSFESHFAHYKAGDFYKKHIDAFRGQSNRKLSLVTYLNEGWLQDDEGELIIFDEKGENVIERVYPKAGTLVVFLSEEFPHEVMPATRDRFSIAGWFRVNNSVGDGVDPPR